MSGGLACHCFEREKKVKDRNWAVIDRCCNYSAFNGCRRTPSNYSSIICYTCGNVWRTKADYVSQLDDFDYDRYNCKEEK